MLRRSRVFATAIGPAVCVGAFGLWLLGAPPAYLLVNLAALGAAALITFVVRPATRSGAERLLAILLLGVLALTLGSGASSLDAVHRWVSLGPVRLHAGMVVLPALVVLSARVRGVMAGLSLLLASVIVGIQPDRAAALALTSAALATWWTTRDRGTAVGAVGAVLALVATSMRADPLEPVRHVEHVLHDAWAWSPWLGLVEGAALVWAVLVPVWLTAAQRVSSEAVALATCLAGFAVASLLGPYPTPFVGFSASPILGVGLAVGLMPAGFPAPRRTPDA